MRPELYRTLFNDFSEQQDFIEPYKTILFVITIITNVSVIVFIYLILNHSRNLDTSYKIILLWNIILPSMQTNFFGIIFQPFVVLPYFVVFNLSFLRDVMPDTRFMLPMLISFFLLFAFGLFYAVLYNYIIIQQSAKFVLSTRIKTTAISVLVIVSILNYYLLYQTLNIEDQSILKERIYDSDKRCVAIFNEYTAFIISIPKFTDHFLWLAIQFILSATAMTFVIPYMTYRTVVVIRERKTALSRRTSRQQMTIVKMIVFYFMNFTVFVNSPTFYVLFFSIGDFSFIKIIFKIPWSLLIVPMYMLPPITVGVMYTYVFKLHEVFFKSIRARLATRNVMEDTTGLPTRNQLALPRHRIGVVNGK